MTDKEIITCQKSQIEDLKEALEERMQRIKELEAEVERLQDHNLRMARKHYDDGVREFAERLKEEKFPWKNAHLYSTEWVIEGIDTLVKEMTEETDDGYFTKEESEAYQKALSDIAKPTGHNIFDDMEANDE